MSIHIGEGSISSDTSRERIVLTSPQSELIQITSTSKNAYITFVTNPTIDSSTFSIGKTSNIFDLMYGKESLMSLSPKETRLFSETLIIKDIATRNATVSSNLIVQLNGPTDIFKVVQSNAVPLTLMQQSMTSTYFNQSVGIGTSSPEYKLHVMGRIYSTETITGSNIVTNKIQSNNTLTTPITMANNVKIDGNLIIGGRLDVQEFSTGTTSYTSLTAEQLNVKKIVAANSDTIIYIEQSGNQSCNIIDIKRKEYLSPLLSLNSFGLGLGVSNCTSAIEIQTLGTYRSNLPIISINSASTKPLVVDKDANVGIHVPTPQHPLHIRHDAMTQYVSSNIFVVYDSNVDFASLPVDLYSNVGLFISSNVTGSNDGCNIYDVTLQTSTIIPSNNKILGVYQYGDQEAAFLSYLTSFSNDVPIFEVSSNGTLYLGNPQKTNSGEYSIHTTKPIYSSTIYTDTLLLPSTSASTSLNLGNGSKVVAQDLESSNVNTSNIFSLQMTACNITTNSLALPGVAITNAFAITLPQMSYTGDVFTIREFANSPIANDGLLRITSSSNTTATSAVSIQGYPNIETGISIHSGLHKGAYLRFDTPNIQAINPGSLSNAGVIGLNNQGHLVMSYQRDVTDNTVKKMLVTPTYTSFGNGLVITDSAYVGIGFAQQGGGVPDKGFQVKSNKILFETPGSLPMVYISNDNNGIGQMGIGTTSTSYPLHVIGDIYSSTNIRGQQGFFSSNITVVGQATITGNVYANKNILTSSDSNLKEDLKPIVNAMDKVNALTGYTYYPIQGKEAGKRMTGLIAQEVEKVLPEAVSVQPNGFLSVAYGNIAGLFVEAIKEMKKDMGEMKAEIISLRAQLKTLL